MHDNVEFDVYAINATRTPGSCRCILDVSEEFWSFDRKQTILFLPNTAANILVACPEKSGYRKFTIRANSINVQTALHQPCADLALAVSWARACRYPSNQA